MAQTMLALKVLKVEGEAFVRLPDGTLKTIKAGDVVHQGDMLITRNGTVQFEDPSGADFEIPPNHSLVVTPENMTPFTAPGETLDPTATPETLSSEQPLLDENAQDTSEGNTKATGFSFFRAPRADYLMDMRFFDAGNLGRDANEVFSFRGRHTENPRIAYTFDMDRVKFPLYGAEIDYPPSQGEDDFVPFLTDDTPLPFDIKPDVPTPTPQPEPPLPPIPDPIPGPPPPPMPDPIPEPQPEPLPPSGPPGPSEPSGPGGPSGPPPGPANNPPVAQEDENHVTEGDPTPATGNVIDDLPGVDSDPDGDTIKVSGVAAGEGSSPVTGGVGTEIVGTYGKVVIEEDGSYTYTLDEDKANSIAEGDTKTDTFTYTITDGKGGTATTTLKITVTGTNDPPVALPDTNRVTEGDPVPATGNVIEGSPGIDRDPDGDTIKVSGVAAGEGS